MYYNRNRYDNFFLFSRPDLKENGEAAVESYEKCKGFILDNEEFPMSRYDPSR
jgi:hypothetical protein